VIEKMTQTYRKISKIKTQETKEPEIQTPIESELEDLLGDLNPRYFEEGFSLKEAQIRAEASRINSGFNNGFFGGF
jgi:hypothetical protein